MKKKETYTLEGWNAFTGEKTEMEVPIKDWIEVKPGEYIPLLDCVLNLNS